MRWRGGSRSGVRLRRMTAPIDLVKVPGFPLSRERRAGEGHRREAGEARRCRLEADARAIEASRQSKSGHSRESGNPSIGRMSDAGRRHHDIAGANARETPRSIGRRSGISRNHFRRRAPHAFHGGIGVSQAGFPASLRSFRISSMWEKSHAPPSLRKRDSYQPPIQVSAAGPPPSGVTFASSQR